MSYLQWSPSGERLFIKYGVLFCHSSAQELFILLDVRLTMGTVVMGWTMINFE